MTQRASGTVFIVDDDNDFRDSMKWLLESDNFHVAAFQSAQDFLERYNGDMGCMLLDVRMPEINGLALQQILIERGIKLPVIIISGHGDISMAVNAMKSGALDFIEKPFDDAVLLRLVEQGLQHATEMFKDNSALKKIRTNYELLSKREKEVMALVVSGKSNREIAEDLTISPKTVEVHRARVMSKMRAESLPDLVQQANRLSIA